MFKAKIPIFPQLRLILLDILLYTGLVGERRGSLGDRTKIF